jgi:putative protease
VTNYFIRPGVAEIKLETGDIKEGDELLITGPSTGLVRQTVTGLRDESGNEVVIIPRGEVCSIKTGEKVRRSDRVFRWIDASELKKE